MMPLLSDPIPESEHAAAAESTEPQQDSTPDERSEYQVEAEPQQTEVVLSRRQRARQKEHAELTTQITSAIEAKLAAKDAEYRAELARRDAEIARVRGAYEAIQPMLQQRQAPAQAEVTPEQLYAEAQKALDSNDFATYQRKFAEAVKRDTLSSMPQPQVQQQTQQLPPEVLLLMARYPEASRNMKKVAAYDGLLEADGIPPGPERYERAFKLAQDALGAATKLAQGPRYATDARAQALLTGSGPSAASAPKPKTGNRRVTGLPPDWRRIADAADIPHEEYVELWAKSNPSSVVED